MIKVNNFFTRYDTKLNNALSHTVECSHLQFEGKLNYKL